jgi:hypothetical protein
MLDTTATGLVRVNLTANSFSTWQRSYFTGTQIPNPSISGPTASPAGDGMSNLLKYGLGLNPMIPAAASSGGSVVQTSGAYVFTYQRPASRADITYSVQVSTDLVKWSTSGVTLNQVGFGDPQAWQAVYAPGNAPSMFFRLNIAQP